MSIEKADQLEDNRFNLNPQFTLNALRDSLVNTLGRIIAAGNAKYEATHNIEEQPVFPLAAHLEHERRAMQEVLEQL